MVNGIKDYEFQNSCVEYLIDKTLESDSKQVITVKAPTGAGKTVVLIKYVDELLKNSDGKTAFVWLCPGKGNLEEQSKDKMDALAPQIETRNLLYSMLTGFSGGSVTFINWELVTKKGNTALKDSERANLFEKIAEAHKEGIRFVVIIDEEHMNNTKKADDIRTIRMSSLLIAQEACLRDCSNVIVRIMTQLIGFIRMVMRVKPISPSSIRITFSISGYSTNTFTTFFLMLKTWVMSIIVRIC